MALHAVVPVARVPPVGVTPLVALGGVDQVAAADGGVQHVLHRVLELLAAELHLDASRQRAASQPLPEAGTRGLAIALPGLTHQLGQRSRSVQQCEDLLVALARSVFGD